MIRITAADLENGDKGVREIEDDVVVICAGRHYVDSIQKHANGTQIYTIKVDKS